MSKALARHVGCPESILLLNEACVERSHVRAFPSIETGGPWSILLMREFSR